MFILKNPFTVYVLTFIIVLLLYTLGWSNLLPPISYKLYLFFFITFVISIYFAAILQRTHKLIYVRIKPNKFGFIIMIFLFLGYILEFIYFGGVPVFSFFSNSNLKFVHFGGIPTFHVLLISFNTFYSVFLFHVFLSTRKSKDLVYLLFSILPPILIFNRGMFISIFIGAFFVFIISKKHISLKQFGLFSIILGLVLYFFGLSGNYRVSRSSSSEDVLKFYEATPQFKESIIPSEYLWSYMYFVAPVGNVQKIVQSKTSTYSFSSFMLNNIIPDFIAKRIAQLFNIKTVQPPLISPMFNVGTMYYRAFYDYGWIGMIIVFLFQCMLIFITIALLPKHSIFFVTGVAVLNTIVLLNSFTNIMVFSGISFQLVWIFLFVQLERYKFRVS